MLYRINIMSRIGKKSIKIPSTVILEFSNNNLKIKGEYGKIEKQFLNYIHFIKKENELIINCIDNTKEAKSYYGLSRALIQNMIIGVNQLFKKILIIEGVGYKFQLDPNFLILNIGYTHPVKIKLIPNINLKLENPTKLIIEGINKEYVGLFAAKVRDMKLPEPYKGKGILYEGEIIRRKTGKK